MSENQLTSTEAADELGISEATVRRYIHSGVLRANKRGSMWFVDACSVDRLANAELDEYELADEESDDEFTEEETAEDDEPECACDDDDD